LQEKSEKCILLTSFIIFGKANTIFMKILLSLLLFVFLSFESFAQKKETQPFGVRYYGYMNSPHSRNISFSAKKKKGKGSRRWAYIDLQYKNLLFYNAGGQKVYHETNQFFTGAEARINVPYRRHLVSIGYAMFMPVSYSMDYHPYYNDFREGDENVTALSFGYSYLFTLGTGKSRQLFFLNLGQESIKRTLKFTQEDKDDPEDAVSPSTTFNTYKIGLGHHFHEPWYWETSFSIDNDGAKMIGLGMGYRIAIKR